MPAPNGIFGTPSADFVSARCREYIAATTHDEIAAISDRVLEARPGLTIDERGVLGEAYMYAYDRVGPRPIEPLVTLTPGVAEYRARVERNRERARAAGVII